MNQKYLYLISFDGAINDLEHLLSMHGCVFRGTSREVKTEFLYNIILMYIYF